MSRRISLLFLAMFLFQALATGALADDAASRADPDMIFEHSLETSGYIYRGVVFRSETQAILVGDSGVIRSYDVSTNTVLDIQERYTVSNRYEDVDISPDGEALAVGSDGAVISVDPSLLKHPKTSNTSFDLKAVSWRADGAYANVVGVGGAMLRYYPETAGLEELGEAQVSGYDAFATTVGDLTAIDWRPDGSYALIVSYGGHVLRFTGDNLTDISGGATDRNWHDVAWSPSGGEALLVGTSSNITKYDAGTESFENLTLPMEATLYAVAWNDATSAYVVGVDGSSDTRFFFYDGGNELVDVSPTGSVPDMYDIGFSSDGAGGVAAGSNGIMRLPNGPPARPSVHVKTVAKTSITVGLTWTPEPDFHKFEFHISTEEGFTPGSGTIVEEDMDKWTTQFTYTPLQEATSYYVVVRVCDNSGQCTGSDELATSTLDPLNPPAVMLTVTEIGFTEVDLEWTQYAADDFLCYDVIYEDDGILFYPKRIENRWTTSHTVTGLTPGTFYRFWITTSNNAEHSASSDPVEVTTLHREAPPQAELTITPDNDNDYFRLEWTKWDSSDLKNYEIHFSSSSGFVPNAETRYTTVGQSYDDTVIYDLYYYSVPSDRRQYVKVLTVDNYDVWSESNELWIYYDTAPPAVEEVTVRNCDAHSCEVNWKVSGSPPDDFDHFEIFKVEGGKEERIGKVTKYTTNYYKASDLKASTSYYFRVYVVDDAGFKSQYKQSSVIHTEADQVSEFMELFGNPGCICGAGWFAFIILLSLLINLGKKYGAKGAAWGIPLMVALVVWVGINFYELVFEESIDKWFLWPLLIICIILSIVIGASSALAKAAKRAKWRREERQREERRRQEEFDSKRMNTDGKIMRLSQRLTELKQKAPYTMYEEAQRSLHASRTSFALVRTVDDRASLDEAANHAENAERIVVDIEAYVVAKQQAINQIRGAKDRVDALKEKDAPRIREAVVVYREAERKLEEAMTIGAVQDVITRIGRINQACDESEMSLKDAHTQLADLKSSLAFIRTRIGEIEGIRVDKERESIGRLKEIARSVEHILVTMGDRPDLEKLAVGREKIREGRDISTKVDERERQRQVLLSDIDILRSQLEETATWSSAKLGAVESLLQKATSAFDKDQLGAGRSAVDEGFGKLESIKESSRPRLMVVPVEQEMLINRWEDLMIELKNDGTANAQEIDIDISSPSAQLQEMKDEDRSTFVIRPGDLTKVPVAIQFTAEGSVPLSVFVRYSDTMGRSYEEEVPLRVEVVHRKSDKGDERPSAKADLEEFGLKVIKRGGISHGFYKFKVSIQNKGETAAREVNFRLIYEKKIFRLHHIWPKEYKLVGDSVDYGTIEPGTTTSVEYYLEAHMCTETKLDGVVTFKDMYGTVHSRPIQTHRETFVCPTLIDVDSITPAQVKAMVTEPGWKMDTWTFAVPSTLNLQYTFDIMKEAVEKYDPNLKHVFDDRGDDPFFMESWYYGEAESMKKGEGIKHIVIGRVQKEADVGYSLQITGASMHQGQLFALSSRLSASITETIQKKANLTRPIQQIFQTVEIKDSVIQGSQISMGTGEGVVAPTGATGKTSIKDSVMVRSDVKTGAGETEIEGTVLQRSTVGTEDKKEPSTGPVTVGTQVGGALDQQREFAYNVYRQTLRQVYEDGIVTMDERNILKGLRKQLSISMEEHELLEEEILKEMGQKDG